jgi:serine/threonine-protein kinase RsbW
MEDSRTPSPTELQTPSLESKHHRKHAPEYKTTVASKLDNLAKIHAFVEDVGNRLSLPPDFLFDVQTAIGEACTNIVQHAYSLRADKPIMIGCRLRHREFIVRIKDFGQPFSPEGITIPKVNVKLEDRRLNGLGIYLMKKLMNRVKYDFDPLRGNELTMTKKLPESAVVHGT